MFAKLFMKLLECLQIIAWNCREFFRKQKREQFSANINQITSTKCRTNLPNNAILMGRVLLTKFSAVSDLSRSSRRLRLRCCWRTSIQTCLNLDICSHQSSLVNIKRNYKHRREFYGGLQQRRPAGGTPEALSVTPKRRTPTALFLAKNPSNH